MRNIVKKRNTFIQGKFDLSVSEQRLLLLGIAQIKKEDLIDDKKIYQINIKDIDDKFVKYNRTRISEFCDKLMSKIVNLPITDKKIAFDKVHLVSNMVYFPEIGTIEMEFHKKLKPHLFELGGKFTTYHLQEVMSFKSKYSIRIYELLSQYKDTNHKSLELELTELYDILDLTKRMRQVSTFRERILEVAKKEINKHSNIQMSYQMIKHGRSFKSVKFIINNNMKNIENRKILETSDYMEEQLSEILNYVGTTDEMKHLGEWNWEYVNNFFNSYFSKFFLNKKFLIHNDIYTLLDYKLIDNKEKGVKTYEIKLTKFEEDRHYKVNTEMETLIDLYYYLNGKTTTDEDVIENLFNTKNIEAEF